MSLASQVTILRHGRLALKLLRTGPTRTSEIAKHLKVDLRVAQRLVHDLKLADYQIETEVDGQERRYVLMKGAA